ncbi:MAG: flavodoxin, partial [Thermoleophilia bacterium]|nr:flavodoxin [Thermoleophilia bacterium]
MGGPILVTFATRHGSTREVAEAVTDMLREAGLEVELKPAREVKDLDAYGGIVIGAPLQMYR